MDQGAKRYHRHSVRLKDYDYSSPGAYFITVVTHKHMCIMGKVISGVMKTNTLGLIAQECWQQIPDHFPNTFIEPFMLMPNHIHGIITIYEDDRSTIYRAPTTITTERFGKPVIGSIPTIIRTYKATVSRRARRELGMDKIWQRNYYEHIIRNQDEMEHISAYILNNPQTWSDDPENHP